MIDEHTSGMSDSDLNFSAADMHHTSPEASSQETASPWSAEELAQRDKEANDAIEALKGDGERYLHDFQALFGEVHGLSDVFDKLQQSRPITDVESYRIDQAQQHIDAFMKTHAIQPPIIPMYNRPFLKNFAASGFGVSDVMEMVSMARDAQLLRAMKKQGSIEAISSVHPCSHSMI